MKRVFKESQILIKFIKQNNQVKYISTDIHNLLYVNESLKMVYNNTFLSKNSQVNNSRWFAFKPYSNHDQCIHIKSLSVAIF